jgi:heptosyltransferase-1
MFYTRQVIVNNDHVVKQNLSLAEAVAGKTLTLPAAELPHDESAEVECDRWLRERHAERFVLLNPGAGWGAKQWPAERYGQIAKQLAQDGLKPVINVGPGEEEIARAVGGGVAETFTGSLTQLIALTRRARLFIGGDTGPMHLAAALSIPVVGIFGPTNPARNGPFGTRNIVLRSDSSLTSYKHVATQEAGMLEISPEQVVGAARELLKERHG